MAKLACKDYCHANCLAYACMRLLYTLLKNVYAYLFKLTYTYIYSVLNFAWAKSRIDFIVVFVIILEI